MTPLVNIRCRPLGASLSRSACGQRYLAAIGPGRGQVAKLISGACRGCELGPAHAGGEAPTTWADGEPVEEVVHVVAGSVLPVRSHKGPAVAAYVPRVRKLSDVARVGNAEGRNGRKAERFPIGGEMLTARQIEALPGSVVDAESITRRIRRFGWDAERARTTSARDALRRAQGHGMRRRA